jgi:hypothetical protein
LALLVEHLISEWPDRSQFAVVIAGSPHQIALHREQRVEGCAVRRLDWIVEPALSAFVSHPAKMLAVAGNVRNITVGLSSSV